MPPQPGQPPRATAFDVTWNVPAVKGLQVRFRNAYWDNGGPQTGYQFRVTFSNYEFDLL